MRTPRQPLRRHCATLTLISVLALSAAGLSGCSFASPAIIATPYVAGAGNNSDITDTTTGTTIQMRNFLLVATTKGKPGVLVGAIANTGRQPVIVTLSVLDTKGQPVATGQVTAAPDTLTQVGPTGTSIAVAAAPDNAGAVTTLHIATSAGGVTMTLPIMAAVGAYASLTASPN